ncbi:MAG: GmrSD restriction endonuclease domain-containing protein [Candidatus Baldrarchaeia archaeon]
MERMHTWTIPTFVKMLESQEIVIPEFQREFVWSEDKVRELVESIYKGYPIGIIILYSVPEHLKESGREKYWILDGQQRILSFALMMKGSIEALRRGKKQTFTVNIWFDPKNKRFERRSPKRGEKWVKLSDILSKKNSEELSRFLNRLNLNPTELDNVLDLWIKFRNAYLVPVYILPDDIDIDELGNIFVRVNFGGTQVRGSDVYSTMLAITQRDLVKELRDFCGTLGVEIDYGVLVRTFIAFLTGRAKLAGRVLVQAKKLKQELEKRKSELRKILEDVKISVVKAIELLDRKLNGVTKKFLPTENVLPVMAYYFYKRGEVSEKERDGLFKWFVLASYFGRYSGNTLASLDEDLSTIEDGHDYRGLIRNLEESYGDLKDRIKKDIQEGEYDILLLYVLLKMNDAKDLLTGQPLRSVDVTVHHIFPRRFLAGTENEEILEDIGNLTLTTSSTNQSLSSRLPEDYLRGIPAEIIRSHLIPENRDLWKMAKCKEFVDERKKLLLNAIDKFFEGL